MLLKDATVATLDPPRVERASLRIEGARIVARGPALAPAAGEEVLDLDGRARAARPRQRPHAPLQRPRARDARPGRAAAAASWRSWSGSGGGSTARSTRSRSTVSGLVGAIEAARSGTTLLFDHHSSPAFVRGSLATLRRAVEEVGLRSVLCYETTDRNGLEGRDAGIAENRGFLASGPTALTRGMLGAHASFTLSDESLERLSSAIRDGRLEPPRPRGRGPRRRRGLLRAPRVPASSSA